MKSLVEKKKKKEIEDFKRDIDWIGLELPSGARIKIVSNTSKVTHYLDNNYDAVFSIEQMSKYIYGIDDKKEASKRLNKDIAALKETQKIL